MPLYDFQCTQCGKIIKDVYAKSDDRYLNCSCGNVANRLMPAPAGHVFKSGIYEHITEEPVYIKSKAELRAITRDNNCTSDYAE